MCSQPHIYAYYTTVEGGEREHGMNAGKGKGKDKRKTTVADGKGGGKRRKNKASGKLQRKRKTVFEHVCACMRGLRVLGD